MKREIYLKMRPLQEAKDLWFERFPKIRRSAPERISVFSARGRVTASPVFARWSYPTFHSAAMDGIATKAELTYGASERNPKYLLLGKEAQWINTGQPLPLEYDCVIMVEKLHQLDETRIEIRAPAYPWQHIRKIGEDIVSSEMILPVDHMITPYDMGVLVATGVRELEVWKRPKVFIVPTGNELVSLHMEEGPKPPPPPKVVESNSVLLKALVEEAFSEGVITPIVEDDLEALKGAILASIEGGADLVMVNAGSSAGSKDFTAQAIRELGQVLIHGVAMMPGKPTVLGVVGGIPVVGNPGYPVSAVLSFREFVRPLLLSLQGIEASDPPRTKVRLTRPISSKAGIDEFVRVSIGRVKDEELVAIPLPRAAGSLVSLQRAEGIIRVPKELEGLDQDEVVDSELLVSPEVLKKTLVIIGSHDMTIDLIRDEMKRQGMDLRLISSNVGSLGGLLALKRGHCHIAGSHLLDPETGEYNRSYVARYLKNVPVAVFHLVKRIQGFIVTKGNPKEIKGIKDLTRPDVKFVNRQAGSGTRLLLDYILKREGIDPREISGYDHEEYTHMAVAVDIKSGLADCGLGILASAQALDLDFIPLASEQYDLVIPKSFLGEELIQAFLRVIRGDEFRRRAHNLGGYDPSMAGELFFEMD